MNRRKQQDEKRRDRSPFTRWVMGAISVILIGSASFAMLMFGNDSVFRVTQEQKSNAGDLKLPVTYSQEKITVPKKDGNTILGNVGTSGSGEPSLPGISGSQLVVSADGAQIVMALGQPGYDLSGYFEPYKDQYGLIYDSLIAAGYPQELAIGAIANFSSEGCGGMRQSTYAMITRSEAETCVANGGKGIKGGVGTAQWTYHTRRLAICQKYLNADVFDANGNAIPEKAIACDIELILEEVASYYPSIQSVNPSNVEEYAEAFCDMYEKPGASCGSTNPMRYVRGDSNHGSACEKRVNRATIIVNYLNGGN